MNSKESVFCKRNCSGEELLVNVPSDEKLEDYSSILKSIADPTRLKIIYLLKNGELCVCEILDAFDKSQSTISHHLNMMKKEGIINGRKQGKWIYYKLANDEIIETLKTLFELIR